MSHVAACDRLLKLTGRRGFPYCGGCYAHLFFPKEKP